MGSTHSRSDTRPLSTLVVTILTVLSAVLVTLAALSLQWRMAHDAPIMMYLAFLMDQFGYVPYRDFFDMNTPGVYAINVILGNIFGYSDLAFRCADLLILAITLLILYKVVRKLDRVVAWSASVFFGLLYLGGGPALSMQREYLLLLPLLVAVMLVSSFPRLNLVARSSLVGLLIGVSSTIKPHIAIVLPLLATALLKDKKTGLFGRSGHRSAAATLLSIGLGFLLPFVLMFTYLQWSGAWPHFWRIVKDYWPLYAGLTGGHQTLSGFARVHFLYTGYLNFGYYSLWLIPAGLGVFVTFASSTQAEGGKRVVALLTGLALLCSLYPVIAGKFWSYHWLPFQCFVLAMASSCFVERPHRRAGRAFVLPAAIALTCMFLLLPRMLHMGIQESLSRLRGDTFASTEERRADEIAAFLDARLRPGDRVQPLDWVGGVVRGMLLARAVIATPYVYDFHFYHHLSRPYIQGLREDFLHRLKTTPPRFIIEATGDRSVVSGYDTSQEFGALAGFLDSSYAVARQTDTYIIYERKL